MTPDATKDRPSAFPWPPVLLAAVVAAALAIDWLAVPLPVPFAETLLVEILGALLEHHPTRRNRTCGSLVG